MQRDVFVRKNKAMNALHAKFYCGEGNKGGRLSEFLILTTACLSTNLEGGEDVKTSIQNRKVFELAWPNPVGPKSGATK